MNVLSPLCRGAGRPGKFIPVFFLLFCTTVYPQEIFRGAVPLSLGGCYVTESRGAWAGGNEGSLGFTPHPSLAMEHWQPFIVADVSVSGVSGTAKLPPGFLGLSLQTWGITGYHRTALQAAYGMKLGEDFSAGVGFRCDLVSAAGELAYQWRLAVSLGVLYRAGEKLTLGAHLSDPLSVSGSRSPLSALPSSLALGLNWATTPGLLLCMQLSYGTVPGLRLSLGTEWQVSERIRLRAGYGSNPSTPSMGLSVGYGKWELQLALPWITGLGLSPAAGLTRTF
ncbi:MAG: hypothetical protein ACOYXB_13150 [Bacteroidota bacterium]